MSKIFHAPSPTALSNTAFYQNMRLDTFREYAQLIGMDRGADVAEVMPYLRQAASVAELGSGYGRVIYFLREMGFEGPVFSVERVGSFLEYQKTFLKGDNTYLCQDILDLELPAPVDAILWMWSGIMEQSREEQQEALALCHRQLLPGGRLFIEMPYAQLAKMGTAAEGQPMELKTEWGTLYAYFPSGADLQQMAEESGFLPPHKHTYPTSADITRVIYILEKA